ncbi:hypothetical protein LS684_03835 [Cytobacillus spongiae]|jgi:amino acid transporter|uniref:hypothetical protein n=1 Tax=Cytobacillus spongiae TaxID=2901381 RepID=UPI001F23E249|nr:hypothetical protein [Cytobacillus spongiae]UII56627.1 hypothetical protein LS684_03835 [Cytobacillus spongiae]
MKILSVMEAAVIIVITGVSIFIFDRISFIEGVESVAAASLLLLCLFGLKSLAKKSEWLNREIEVENGVYLIIGMFATPVLLSLILFGLGK